MTEKSDNIPGKVQKNQEKSIEAIVREISLLQNQYTMLLEQYNLLVSQSTFNSKPEDETSTISAGLLSTLSSIELLKEEVFKRQDKVKSNTMTSLKDAIDKTTEQINKDKREEEEKQKQHIIQSLNDGTFYREIERGKIWGRHTNDLVIFDDLYNQGTFDSMENKEKLKITAYLIIFMYEFDQLSKGNFNTSFTKKDNKYIMQNHQDNLGTLLRIHSYLLNPNIVKIYKKYNFTKGDELLKRNIPMFSQQFSKEELESQIVSSLEESLIELLQIQKVNGLTGEEKAEKAYKEKLLKGYIGESLFNDFIIHINKKED